MACITRKGRNELLYVGETAGRLYRKIGWPVFSADGKVVAYSARIGHKEFMCVNGKRIGPFECVGWPVFGPTGHVPCFYVRVGRKQAIVRGENVGPQFDCVSSTPRFSPDGKTMAYDANANGQWHVVIDSRVGMPFDLVSPPTFSRNGKRVIYAAVRGCELLHVTEPIRTKRVPP